MLRFLLTRISNFCLFVDAPEWFHMGSPQCWLVFAGTNKRLHKCSFMKFLKNNKVNIINWLNKWICKNTLEYCGWRRRVKQCLFVYNWIIKKDISTHCLRAFNTIRCPWIAATRIMFNEILKKG